MLHLVGSDCNIFASLCGTTSLTVFPTKAQE